MPTTTVYSRISDVNIAYLERLASASSLTRAQVIDRIITEARTRGWSIEVDRTRVTGDPGQ